MNSGRSGDWESKMSCDSQFPSPAASGTTYTIQGVTIKFPYKKAYASQITMMDKILQSLKTRRHCLLESPTGSGKTLALLCAALSWQKKERDIYDNETKRIQEEMLNQLDRPMSTSSTETISDNGKTDHGKDDSMMSLDASPTIITLSDDDDDDDFKPEKLATKFGYTKNLKGCNSPCGAKNTTDASKKAQNNSEKQQKQDSNPTTLSLPPKIFFGTRTHQQITQIIRELRKTEHRNVRMTILGSREHTCIHPTVKTSKFKNEECQELIKNQLKPGGGCRFYDTVNNGDAMHCLEDELPTCWDIEELVDAGKKLNACPYFLTHELLVSADIVFCPYNYLIDSSIRQAMDINLNGAIVMFDEAHNMEDTARSAASLSITLDEITAVVTDCDKCVNYGYGTSKDEDMIRLFSRLSAWLSDQANKNTEWNYLEFSERSKVWDGMDFVAVMTSLGWGPEEFHNIATLLDSMVNDDSEKRGKKKYQYDPTTKFLCRGLLPLLKYLFKDKLRYTNDYKVVLTKSTAFGERQMQQDNRRRSQNKSDIVVTLKFICMNPAVAFSDFCDIVHAIVLTSGTLSPLETFESELGVKFPIRFEANHVIDAAQVWVGILGYGLDGSSLNASFRNADTYNFQDSVGNIVLEICKKTPHGVLCFFSSYSMLDKITNRWNNTGLWETISAVKEIFVEPKRPSKEDFVTLLNNFCHANTYDYQSRGSSRTGALFLAVCRGKVSEGMDFSDGSARAVIEVGIPFPNIKSVEISLKRAYNDSHFKSRNLLSGSQWYEIQAFRALNQALGRCIRHRNDWGALILIDERFLQNQSYVDGLSKWVRTKIARYSNTTTALNYLKGFMEFAAQKYSPSRLLDPLPIVAPSQLSTLNESKMPESDKVTLTGIKSPQQSVDKFFVNRKESLAPTSQTWLSNEPGTSCSSMDVSSGTTVAQTEYQSSNNETSSAMQCSPEIFSDGLQSPSRCVPLSAKRKGSAFQFQQGARSKLFIDDGYNSSQVPGTQTCVQGIVCGKCGTVWKNDFADVTVTRIYPELVQNFDETVFTCACDGGALRGSYLSLPKMPANVECKTEGLCNAIWDDNNKCCYTMLVCQSCKSNAAIQFKSSSKPLWDIDQVWFLYRAMRFCPQKLLRQAPC